MSENLSYLPIRAGKHRLVEHTRRVGETTYVPPLTSTKVGRNEPCPCGSQRKFKKCCGKEKVA